jgi:hypothetical protein
MKYNSIEKEDAPFLTHPHLNMNPVWLLSENELSLQQYY